LEKYGKSVKESDQNSLENSQKQLLPDDADNLTSKSKVRILKVEMEDNQQCIS
jgi:hypothetical protein